MGYQSNFCTGGTASATRYYLSFVPANAFDGSNSTYWDGYPWQSGDYIQYDLGAGITKTAAQYTLRSGSPNYPKSWTFAGSNNGSDWTTIDTQTNQTLTQNVTHKYNSFTNTTAYRYYRWTISAMNTGTEPYMAEIGCMEYTDDNVVVVASPLSALISLFAAPHILVSAPAFESTAGLTVAEINLGAFVDASALAVGTGLSASYSLILSVPDMAASASMSCAPAVAVHPGPLSMRSVLYASGCVLFVDRNYQITYLCTLGTATIPITSFQARFKSGTPSFLSVVVPGVDYSDDIIAQSGRELRIYMVKTYKSGAVAMEMLGEVLQTALRIDEGSMSQSITIDGYDTVTHGNPKAVTVTGCQYRAVYGGSTRYRCAPDFRVLPGDTITVGDDVPAVVSSITWAISVGSELMEIETEGA